MATVVPLTTPPPAIDGTSRVQRCAPVRPSNTVTELAWTGPTLLAVTTTDPSGATATSSIAAPLGIGACQTGAQVAAPHPPAAKASTAAASGAYSLPRAIARL